MILRKSESGEPRLVALTDHSQLVGQMAAHWGNDLFAAPRQQSVARAATYHDYGWLLYEAAPLIDRLPINPMASSKCRSAGISSTAINGRRTGWPESIAMRRC